MSRRRLRREVSIPLWWFIAWLLAFFLSLLALLAMGLTLFGGEHAPEQTKFWISLAEEVIKAGAFGGIIAAVLHNRFEALFEEGIEASLKTHGIEELHLSREQAADDILAWIGDRGTTELWIAGISLRDFLPARGRLRNAWDAIWERLEDEKFRNLPDEKRLHVKLLLLDPRSAEGMFRYHVESETLDRGSLQEDVQNSIQQYKNVLDRIYAALPSKYLELRLYEHGSFAFMVLTDEHALVEQYCYRDHTLAPAFPLIQYAKKSRSYSQVRYSLRVTWNHARELEHALHRVGTAKGVRAARIANIYRHDDRGRLSERELKAIRDAPAGELRIGAITARYYLQQAREELQRRTQPGEGRLEVKLLIVNPVSEAAIVRAITESSEPRVRDALHTWNWSRHRKSRLYHDARNTLDISGELRGQDHSIEARLTPVAPSCAILRTADAVFVEQYLLGRSRRFERGGILGGEYPVFEFATPQQNGQAADAPQPDVMEEELLDATFKLLWDNFSISTDAYAEIEEERQFETNLRNLKASLSPTDEGFA